MAGGSNGSRAALVRRQPTPGPISSLPGTAGSPPSISFSTSSPELLNAGLEVDHVVPRFIRCRRPHAEHRHHRRKHSTGPQV